MKLSAQELADILPEAMLFFDEFYQLQHWNQMATSWFNLTSTHRGQALTNIIPVKQLVYKIEHSENHELIIKWGNAHRQRLALRLLQREDGVIFLARDVTREETLGRMRQDFIANVSHELRTPLTVVCGYLESLIEQADLDKKQSDIYRQMFQQSQRMQNLVEDLLLLTHLENEQTNPTDDSQCHISVMLSHIVRDANVLAKGLGHDVQFELKLDETILLIGAQKELVSLFSNLIFNAVKYTPQGRIEISWQCVDKQGIFSVRDSGIGIDKAYIPRITERFYRVDKARSRQHGGTGLGLAIVKHVLIRHDAELKVCSELGQGSTFSCLFPIERTLVTKLS